MKPALLSPARRVACIAASVAVVAAFAGGTISHDDNWFPFAPFRMFSTATNPDGQVNVYRVEGVNAEGERLTLDPDVIGMRWAEIEGQKEQMAADPLLARNVADAYDQRNPSRPQIVAVELIFAYYDLENGSATGECEEDVVASWYHEDYPTPQPSDGSLSDLSCSGGVFG